MRDNPRTLVVIRLDDFPRVVLATLEPTVRDLAMRALESMVREVALRDRQSRITAA
jgi:hypothetical protein